MSDAAKIIGMLEATYPCASRGCDNGTASMTLAPKWVKERDCDDFVYQCDTCGVIWYQNGEPILWPEPEEETGA